MSVWLRKPINLEGPERHFFCCCAKLIITLYKFRSKYILPYRSFLTCRSWILEYGFIFKIAFIRLCFHQHYNINIETFISTHVCLVPVAFSVNGRKCEFDGQGKFMQNRRQIMPEREGISTKKGQIHQKY